MCRVFGCVAAEPVSIRHELLEAENPLIRQSEDHDSGWGMAVYERAEGAEPRLVRFPEAAHADGEFVNATGLRGRIFNVHVRRATMGHLTLNNTHPFCLGSYTLGHNGTILRYPRLLEPGMKRPRGDTDSEHLFNLLMHDFDDDDPVACLRETMRRAVECSPFSGLNVLFSDGEKLFAYRLGLFDLHWKARPGQLLVASERVTGEPGWHSVQQDVLLTLDPNDLEEPHAERLLGDGLLRPLAGALKGTEAALAIVPCGRGNDLARVLGIPEDPGEAARIAVEGRERLLDVANVEGTPYMGIASFGFDSEANRIANEAKLVRGNAVYVYAALRALLAWKPAGFTVTVDGERREFSGYTVAVGNSNAYGGGMYVFPMAELDDGQLDVIVCKRISKLRFLTELPKVFKGTHVDRDFAE